MSYTNAVAEAANDAIVGTITKLRLYTAGYASQLADIPITFDASVVSAGEAVSTAASLPIADTWDASGTVGAFRYLNVSNATIFEGTGAWAVGTSGSGSVVELSSVSAVEDGPLNVTNATHAFPTKLEGEP